MKTVKARVPRHSGGQRRGRGFSRNELRKAGTSLTEAVKLGLPVDPRRKTAHEENVAAARSYIEGKKAPVKQKKKPKS